jgi:hypothetical protein
MTASPTTQLAHSHDLAGMVSRVLHTRATLVQNSLSARVRRAFTEHVTRLLAKPVPPWDAYTDWSRYAAQRWVFSGHAAPSGQYLREARA